MNVLNSSPKLHPSWLRYLEGEFQKPYFQELKLFLQAEKQSYNVYPPGAEIFNALNYTPLDEVKVVIIGQDPYHAAGQAHGLCFSVKDGVPLPPSLRNVFKEINTDLGISMPSRGDLTPWARQGVLLLNATLTVRSGEAGSHQNKGWEQFTDRIIDLVNQQRSHVVFMLWGRFAQNKAHNIDDSKHLLLKAAHPSPLSAHNGFLGCRHFSKANLYLKENGLQEIDWRI
jgi:uracil-DNA glycosylase